MPDSLKFQLELVDKLTRPGKEMAAQMQKLKLQLGAATKAVSETERAMNKLQKAKVVDIASYRQLAKQLEAQKAAQNGLRGEVLKQAEAMRDAGDEAEGAQSSFFGLSQVLANPMVAAITAVVAAEAAMIAGGMGMAIHAAELKNDTVDALEAFLDTGTAAQEVYERIEDIQKEVAISQERGMSLARELSAAGVTNADALTDAIRSIGMVESVLGGGAGSRIQSIITRATAGGKFQISARQLKGTGLQESAIAAALGLTPKQLDAQMKAGKITAEAGIAALTKAIDQKFGKVAGKQLLDIGSQFQSFKDNVMQLFEDVNTDGFLGQLHDILSVFDQSTESGKALKMIVTNTFDAIFKATEAVAPYVKTFFKGLVIIALQVYIAFKPLLAQLGAMGPASDGPATLASVMSVLGQVIGSVVSVIVSWIQTGVSIAQWFISVETYLLELPGKFYDAGAAIITGLVNGIMSAPTKLADSIRGMAQGALAEFKSVFGIASPSKVMAQMGGHLMGGLEKGIDTNSSKADSAMSDAVAPPVAKSSGGGGSGNSITITVAPGAIVISGVQNAQQVADMLPEILANTMEELMLEKGVAA